MQGRTAYPWRKQAVIAITHSGRLPSSVSTTSPGSSPVRASRPASAPAAAETSPKLHSRRRPSLASSTIASRSGGAASTTSLVKFIGTPGSLLRGGS